MCKKINKFIFPINFFNFKGKTEFIDLFAPLEELEVLKYLPSFPYLLKQFDSRAKF